MRPKLTLITLGVNDVTREKKPNRVIARSNAEPVLSSEAAK
ncbi:MAG TPA: hypothetical protein VFA55_03680 [Candidatus Kapabacteria bacterium]|nr:hypothetical protein [Candidatus Kapabacteria bacterium]